MSSKGRHHGAAEARPEHAAEAGRRSNLPVPHLMLPNHVDNLQLVVNSRRRNGVLLGYDGQCSATGEEVQRTYFLHETEVKDKDGRVIRTDTRTDIVPHTLREEEADNG